MEVYFEISPLTTQGQKLEQLQRVLRSVTPPNRGENFALLFASDGGVVMLYDSEFMGIDDWLIPYVQGDDADSRLVVMDARAEWVYFDGHAGDYVPHECRNAIYRTGTVRVRGEDVDLGW